MIALCAEPFDKLRSCSPPRMAGSIATLTGFGSAEAACSTGQVGACGLAGATLGATRALLRSGGGFDTETFVGDEPVGFSRAVGGAAALGACGMDARLLARVAGIAATAIAFG